jgi:hypothetical protein
VAVYCKHGNELSGSMKGGEFLDQLKGPLHPTELPILQLSRIIPIRMEFCVYREVGITV